MSTVRDKLAAEIKACRLCPQLDKPPAAGYGSETSPVMLVGQSLCGPCVATGVPFTGGCERLILAALGAVGKVKEDVFITNVVHCHPPRNRKSKQDEKDRCATFLRRELAMVRPLLIVTLGKDAREAIRNEYQDAQVVGWWEFPAAAELPSEPPADGPVILSLYHPSHVLKPWTAPQEEPWVTSLAAAVAWAWKVAE